MRIIASVAYPIILVAFIAIGVNIVWIEATNTLIEMGMPVITDNGGRIIGMLSETEIERITK